MLIAGALIAPGEAKASCSQHTDCNDNNACTTDYCTNDGCVNLDTCGSASVGAMCEANAHCNDNLACTTDQCGSKVEAGCKTWSPICVCAGWFECATDPSCLELICTEPLLLGSCSQPPTQCEDNNACTSDGCTEPGGCWHTPLANGSPCQDSNPCTISDTCQTGACTPGPALSCDDGKTCTTDSCVVVNDPVLGPVCQSQHTVVPGTCLIDGVCRSNGQVNPLNPCERCEWATSQTSWTTFSPPELCNNKDDDCDGLIDENFNIGQLCDGPDPDLCVEEGGWRCQATGGQAYCADGPVGLWLHRASPAGQVLDESGFGHHGTVVNGNWSATEQALYFNGVDSVITIPGAAALRLPHGFTFEAWLRPEVTAGFWAGVLGQVRTPTRFSYTVRLGASNSPAYVVQSGYGCPTKLFSAFNSSPLVTGAPQWVHVVVTVDWAGKQIVYLNGAADQELVACGENTGTTSTEPIYIGRAATVAAADFYKGWMRRIALYNYPRTAAQIAASFAAGRVPDGFFNAEICNGLDDDCDGLTDEGFGTDVACDAADADGCFDDRPLCAPSGLSAECGIAGPVGYYTFEEGAGSTALDYSGEGRDAGIQGSASYEAGHGAAGSGVSLETAGSGGLQLSTAGLNNSHFTFAAWVRPTGWAGGGASERALMQTNAPSQSAGWLAVLHNGSGQLRVEAGTSAFLSVPATGLLPSGEWTHLAATWSRTDYRLRIYINGAMVAQGRDRVWASASLPSLMRIARPAGATGGWVGAIDNAALYARELEANEVASLFGAGVPIIAANLEICDSIDNDCDGLTDEGFPTLGLPCDTNDDDFCENGQFTCTANGLAVECASEAIVDIIDICNGLDDDCDGLVDEDFPLLGVPCDGADDDLCFNGTFTCTPDGSGVECVNEDPAGLVELCNGVDDDCDGQTDEDFPLLGEACDGEDSDQCEYGTFTCTPAGDSVECVNEDPFGVVDVCNGQDDDCDGLTDEDFPLLGLPCDGADSDFCANGTYTCAFDTQGVECINEVVVDIAESCNGFDDDCDGLVDEDFPLLGVACDGPDSDFCENGAFVCTLDGSGVVCGPEGPADIAELCNSQDDDCDGQTDEDFPLLGEACDGADDDHCENGTYTCRLDGAGVECINEEPAGLVEQCNGLDDDCDGQTDEDFPLLGAPCDGPDPDACEDGTFTCRPDGAALECINDPPEFNVELCNGTDDDCDGEVDEGFPLGLPCDGPDADFCENGQFECTADGSGVVCGEEWLEDIEELCNGIDDDCDGQTDEGFAGVGAPCDGPDDDLCENGVVVCTADGSGTTCGAEVPEGIEELCNGLDDDCDGLIDEDFPLLGTPCDGPDSDLCANGLFECNAFGQMVCGAENPADIAEICNGLDDDCDGIVDEDFPLLGTPCDGPDSDLCANGVFECAPDGTLGCLSEAITDIAETCNGLDDNCDGQTDEDYPLLGAACDGPDADSCANGQFICNGLGTGVECGPESIIDIAEVCNGLDDDCDGVTDEGFPLLGTPCDGPDTDFCANGQFVCDAAETGVECGPESVTNIKELCNGLDDDCDGVVDDAFPLLGTPCDGPDSDLCQNGTYTCRPDGDSVECANETIQNIAELCNGMDDDCDGLIDEDFILLGAPCDGPDADLCPGGIFECSADGTTLVCEGDSPESIVEACNGLDDDCDGLIDEDFPLVGEPCDGADGDMCAEGSYVCTANGLGLNCQGDGPVLYYTFVDQTGSTVFDESGWTHNATRQDGAAWWKSGTNTAIDLDGVNDYLSTPHTAPLSIPYSVTLEAWIYLDKLPPITWGYFGIVSKGNRPRNYSWYITSAGALHLSTGYPYCGSYTGPSVVPVGQWVHIAVVNARGATQSHRHFVNGVELPAVTIAGEPGACNFPVQTNTREVRIGTSEETNRWFDGRISTVLIWDRALTPVEIAAHAASPWDSVPRNRELCDGLDNNCNGSTDEGWPFESKQVGELCDGIGACGIGTVECSGLFGARCSTNPGGSEAEDDIEVCDLLDNDCDGQVDEGYTWTPPGGGMPRAPGQACTAPGICGTGVVECVNPLLVACSTEPGGSSDKSSNEICDGLDNDCDGLTDEGQSWQGFALGGPCPGVGACGPGVVECSPLGNATCSTLPDGSADASSLELCDDIDNDCDGLTDEDFTLVGVGIGGACVGEGACGPGIVECWGPATVGCSSNPGGSAPNASPEECNGVDDDCDGYTDEGDDDSGIPLTISCYNGPEGTEGVGICKPGQAICLYWIFSGFSSCIGETVPQLNDFVCNGQDEDCDGVADEDYVPVPCGLGICANQSSCIGGVEQACVPLPAAATDANCDGIDEDCDGLTDEDYVPVPCGLGVCANASSCRAGVELPCVPFPPTGDDDNCNEIDENCNGVADENFSDGVACTIDSCVEGIPISVPTDALCDDHNPCTDDTCVGDTAVDGGCAWVPNDSNVPPDDGFPCTLDFCEDGEPQHPILSGQCLIDNLCLLPGEYDPSDGCAVCYPPHSQTEWSDTLFFSNIPSTNLPGFAVEVLNGPLTWQASTKRFVSHSLSAYFGNPVSAKYDAGERVRARLWAPERPLGADALHMLHFQLWLQTEAFTASPNIDVLRVIARITDPAAPADPPEEVELWNSTLALGGTTKGAFRKVSVDLSSLAGKLCQIAFEFDSGDAQFNNFEGAYIDDVNWVTACCFENADCDDSNACTIDQCDSSSGKSICNWINTCAPTCVPTHTSVVVVLDRTISMNTALSGASGASRWQSVAVQLGAALAEHEQDLNVALLTTPAPGEPDACAPALNTVEVGWHATAAEMQAQVLGTVANATQTALGGGLVQAHASLNAAGYGQPRAVVLITDVATAEASCADDEAVALQLAADGVPVHVIGVGSGLHVSALNNIAFAGGRARAPDAAGAHFYRADTLTKLAWSLGHVFDVLSAEDCDGIDNDCDGFVDEFVPPRSCNPACGGGGLQSCVAGAWGVCSVDPKEEVCNGKDDDCDGLTDEGWADGAKGMALGSLCSVGQGACTAFGLQVCDVFDPLGPTICGAKAASPKIEICNGVDDDCDGLTDENLSQLCNTQCGGGLQTCVGGVWTGCSVPGAQPEVCNGLDDNCDGFVDQDGFGNPLERACTNGCSLGIEKCYAGEWLGCTAPLAMPETCNGLDDDCDGQTDEGPFGGPLTQVCDDTVVDPGAEGICQFAAQICGAVTPGQWGPCDGVATPQLEVCNGLDDDCDGLTDEADDGELLTEACWTGGPGDGIPGVGICEYGISTCAGGSYGACAGQVTAQNEICDGLDNDCDGQIDENPGQMCLGTPGCHTGLCKCGKKADGTYTCFLD